MSEKETSDLALKKAVQTIVGAMVDLLDSQGMTAKQFSYLAQAAFVKKLESQGLMLQQVVHKSGLSFKTVSKLLSEPLPDEQFNGLDSFLENWRKSPDFPMQLLLDKNSCPNWGDLCTAYQRELTPKYILEYLLNAQCVKIKDGMVHYLSSKINYSCLNPETINYVAFAVENLIDTITHNLLNDDPELYERNSWCVAVDPEKKQLLMDYMTQSLDELRQKFHQFLENNHIELVDKPKNRLEMGMGLLIWKRDNHDKS